MRLLLTLSLIILTSMSFSITPSFQDNLIDDQKWSSAELVSTGSTTASNFPTMAVDSENNIHVVWDDSTDLDGAGFDRDIFYNRWNGTWSSTEVVSTESTSISSSPSIAVDNANNVHVVWYDNTDYGVAGPDFDIFYKYWNGTLWSTTEVISTESTSSSFTPSIATDSANNIHVVWSDGSNYNSSGNDDDIFYKFWNGTWSTTEVVSTESTSDSVIPSITVDDADNLHVVWFDGSNYDGAGDDDDIFYKHCNGTWSTTEVISTESRFDSEYPTIVVDSANNVHVACSDDSDYDIAGIGFDRALGDPDIFYKYWNGTLWSKTDVISTGSERNSLSPSIAVDAANNIHVVWYEAPAIIVTTANIFNERLTHPTSKTEVISTERTSEPFIPSIAMNRNVNPHVTLHDTTHNNSTGTDIGIFYKFWNGRSWSQKELISIESIQLSGEPSIVVDSTEYMHVVWGDITNFRGAGGDTDIFYSKARVEEITITEEITIIEEITTTEKITITDRGSVNFSASTSLLIWYVMLVGIAKKERF